MFQVVPSELEAVLLTHPDVVDAGVFGLPDPQAGELPTALVVRAPSARRHDNGEGHPGLRERFYSLSSADSIQPCLVFSSAVT